MSFSELFHTDNMLPVTLKIYLIALYTSLAGMLWGLDTGEFQEYRSTRLLTILVERFHRSSDANATI